MTIATKTTVAPKGDVEGSGPQTTVYEFRDPEIVDTRRRGLRMLRWFCGCILVVWVVLAVFTTGMMVLNRIRRHRFEGYCGTGAVGKHRAFEQKVMVDTDALNEVIENPDTSESGGIFAHDFVAKVTAIYDRASKTCFVKTSDDRLLPPKDFADMIEKSQSDYYAENILLCHDLYRALKPQLDKEELSGLHSPLIYNLCSGVPTYRLQKVEDRVKRSVQHLQPVIPDWKHVVSTWWDKDNHLYIVKAPGNVCFYKTMGVGIVEEENAKTVEEGRLISVENYQDLVTNYEISRKVSEMEMFEDPRLGHLRNFCTGTVYQMKQKRRFEDQEKVASGTITFEELVPGVNGGKLLQMEIEAPGIVN